VKNGCVRLATLIAGKPLDLIVQVEEELSLPDAASKERLMILHTIMAELAWNVRLLMNEWDSSVRIQHFFEGNTIPDKIHTLTMEAGSARLLARLADKTGRHLQEIIYEYVCDLRNYLMRLNEDAEQLPGIQDFLKSDMVIEALYEDHEWLLPTFDAQGISKESL
jgi:hypothetical protein